MAESAAASFPPLSIMVVDDEIDIREGIRDRIQWESIGYRIAGDFADGRRALEAARKQAPDVLLTDIRMPHLDGIQLAAHLREEHPETTVVLLTGHDEFEYAHAALRLQVDDFLLKPISAAELQKALAEVAERVRRRQQREASAADLRRNWEASLPLLRDRALEAVLRGSASVADAVARCRDLGADLPPGRCRVILLAQDSQNDDESVMLPPDAGLLELGAALDSATAGRSAVFRTMIGNDSMGLLWFGPDDRLFGILEEVRQNPAVREHGSTSAGVGLAVGRLADIRSSYRDARRTLRRRFLEGGDRVYRSGLPESVRAIPGDPREIRRNLVAAVSTVNREAAQRELGTLISAYRSTEAGVSACVLSLQRDLGHVLDAFEELGLDVDSLVLHPDQGDPYQQVSGAPSLDAVHGVLSELISSLLTELEQQRRGGREQTVRAAEQLIRQQYRDPDLSLTEVCERLGVSVSHLSQQFKRVTGRTFVEYLTEVRVEAAQVLLREQSMHSYEIAPQVGFRDPHYFSRAFKRASGISPTEYRARISGTEAAGETGGSDPHGNGANSGPGQENSGL